MRTDAPPENVNTLKRMLWRALVFSMGVVVLLFIIGFVIGLTPWRVPYLDYAVFENLLNGVLGKDIPGEWNELVLNEES